MNKVVLRNPHERAKGLIGMKPIPKDTLYIFPDLKPGTYFHSRGVLEPFEIVFVNKEGTRTAVHKITPPDGGVDAPEWATVAVEAVPGTFPCLKAGDGFRGLDDAKDKPYLIPLLAVMAGAIVAGIGWKNHKNGYGTIAIGVGSSMVATGLIVALNEFNS